MALEAAIGATLLRVARESIRRGLLQDRSLVEPGLDDPALQEPRATFVTLMQYRALRGCIGTLEAQRPLVRDVAHNAEAAAFRDPRFSPLTAAELDTVDIEVSVLSHPSPFPAKTRTELLRHLEPGRHGLILLEASRRATFLPSVWTSMPDPDDFLDQLLHKAGLRKGYWSAELRFLTYTTESFTESRA